MANVSITASAVKTSSSSSNLKVAGISGAAFTAGQPLYQAVNGKLAPCGNNAVAPANTLKGIALDSCPGADQPCFYCPADANFEPGFTPTEGETYVVSSDVGAICPLSDLGSADTVNYVGTGKASGKLDLFCRASGITKP